MVLLFGMGHCWRAALAALAIVVTTFPAIASTITFRNACEPGDRVTIVAVGDLLFHRPLQLHALRKGGSYGEFWRDMDPLIRGADLAYANFEGTAAHGVEAGGDPVKDPGRAFDGRVYGARAGALYYNYHPSVIDDLHASGFDIVSTANNHAMDRQSLGADRTIDNLSARGVAFTGTRKKGETTRPWSTITWAKGLGVAWLACTFDTNGNPDRHGQVLLCHGQKDELLAEVRRLDANPLIDAVIVTPHWGEEGDRQPTKRDRELAAALVEAGAAAVIGSHPHVLQPWALMRGSGEREALVIYSTGNFISNQRRPEQRAGIAAVIELTRPLTPGAKARVTAAGYVPTWVDIRGSGAHRVIENTGKGSGSSDGLKRTLQLLPEGNRIGIELATELPRDCSPAIATAGTVPAAQGLPLIAK